VSGCTDTWVNIRPGALRGSRPWAVSARTLDDTKLYMATLESNPRGSRYAAEAPDGTPGYTWTSKYGFVGVTWAADSPGVYDDGLNERGLSVAQNQLDETVYPIVTDPSRAVDMRSVVAWLLGSAANVSEARALLASSGVQVWGRAGGGAGGDAGAERQHLHMLDAAGATLLAEWTHGAGPRLYGAEEGAWPTTTNSPDWPTMAAMRSYSSANEAAASLNGLPASLDSMSRQKRVALLNKVMPKLNTTQQAVAWAFKVLDSISVPGIAGMPATVAGVPIPSDGEGDFTQWQLVRDHEALTLYSRTWDNPMPKRLALADVNLSAGAPRATFAMGVGTWSDEIQRVAKSS